MSTIKRQLYEYCVNFLTKRIEAAQEAIRMAQDSANDETKSSAGDKYETGRAMMQLEIEKTSAQLQSALKQMEILESIDLNEQRSTVQFGSLVVTDAESFFIAISIGLQKVGNAQFAILSPATPIGKSLMGLRVGDSFVFEKRTLTILEII